DFCFFFQAEDGIRDRTVTGVQTCALPISTPLYFAERLTNKLAGAKIYLKREDLLHTGAHKINNALGQTLLAQRMGKRRIIAQTEIGIASCRERGKSWGGAVAV